MALEINLYEPTVSFERCIVEREQMETRGNYLRFRYRKCINWVKKKVLSSNLSLLRREIFLCGDVLKLQCVMFIKWENFVAFSS
jgi:hypothetical protein